MNRVPLLLLSLSLIAVALLFCGLPSIRAQADSEAGDHEWQVWTAGGHGTNGVTQHTGVWLAGARYGWILTNPHFPSLLRGQLEFAVDAVPVFMIFRRAETAYGAGLDPFTSVWNFQKRGRIVPYAELSGGILFTSKQVPEGTSNVNFTSGGGIGMRFLAAKLNWNADVRFLHISNSDIGPTNPGINTVQLRLGIGMFTAGRHKP